jgi:hypothetical protein
MYNGRSINEERKGFISTYQLLKRYVRCDIIISTCYCLWDYLYLDVQNQKVVVLHRIDMSYAISPHMEYLDPITWTKSLKRYTLIILYNNSYLPPRLTARTIP